MHPFLKNTPRNHRLHGLLIGMPFFLLVLMRIDPIFALTIWLTLWISLVVWQLSFPRQRKLMLLAGVYTITTIVLYRLVSLCLFLICSPVPWLEQVTSAQQAIGHYGNDFTLYAVQARPDTIQRFRGDDPVHWRLSFLFIRTPPNPTVTDAPYQIHTIDLNDRDPQRTIEFIPGAAWLNPVAIPARAQAFATVSLSPRAAAERVKHHRWRQQLPPIADQDWLLTLLLADAVPPDLQRTVVWRVTAKYATDDAVPSYWIDARSGEIIRWQESN